MTEEPKINQYHSDLHRDITLFLFGNRHLSDYERNVQVNVLIQVAIMDGKLTIDDVFNYAAAGFQAMDMLIQNGQKLPEQLMASVSGGKEIADSIHSEKASKKGKKAADARHSRDGGSRDKKAEILRAWESGKYSTRDICAEQEANALNMSFSAARRALRNTPDPLSRCTA